MPAQKPYNVGLIQMRMSPDAKENLAKATRMLEEAAKKGVQVACLPELFMGPYFCQEELHAEFDRAEPIPGPTTQALQDIAKKTGMAIIGSLFERRVAGMYHNTAVIIDADGAHVGTYRKMHIPEDPHYYEKFYFTPGDLGFQAFETKFAKLGTLICWDQWFPEGARATALKGADALFYPTAIGWHPDEKAEYGERQVSAWQTVQRGHAVANRMFVCAVNRVGFEPNPTGNGKGIEFFGHSFIADPDGQVIAQASRDEEEILIATLDPKQMESARRHWPHFRDRRIEHYGSLLGHFEE